MLAVVLETAQASQLHKRFDGWFEIQPMPLKNGKWYVTVDTLLALKEFIIDAMEAGTIPDKPAIRQKAKTFFDALKDLPRGDTDDYPHLMYNTSIDPDTTDPAEIAELAEYTARFQDLVFENVTE